MGFIWMEDLFYYSLDLHVMGPFPEEFVAGWAMGICVACGAGFGGNAVVHLLLGNALKDRIAQEATGKGLYAVFQGQKINDIPDLFDGSARAQKDPVGDVLQFEQVSASRQDGAFFGFGNLNDPPRGK